MPGQELCCAVSCCATAPVPSPPASWCPERHSAWGWVTAGLDLGVAEGSVPWEPVPGVPWMGGSAPRWVPAEPVLGRDTEPRGCGMMLGAPRRPAAVPHGAGWGLHRHVPLSRAGSWGRVSPRAAQPPRAAGCPGGRGICRAADGTRGPRGGSSAGDGFCPLRRWLQRVGDTRVGGQRKPPWGPLHGHRAAELHSKEEGLEPGGKISFKTSREPSEGLRYSQQMGFWHEPKLNSVISLIFLDKSAPG